MSRETSSKTTPLLVMEERRTIPCQIVAWASEWAELNVDMNDESSFLCSHGPDDLLPMRLNLNGGMAPVGEHVDTVPSEAGRFPVWGLLLACPEGELVVRGTDGTERRRRIGTGSVYCLDPSMPHRVECTHGAIAFVGTWGVDPADAFGSLESFAEKAMLLAIREHACCPDSTTFVERSLNLEPGELS